MTHPVATMPVGHQHADENEEHEDPLDGEHTRPKKPVLLHPAWGTVLAALTARPAGETDGHVRVTHTIAVTLIHRGSICIAYRHTHLFNLHKTMAKPHIHPNSSRSLKQYVKGLHRLGLNDSS